MDLRIYWLLVAKSSTRPVLFYSLFLVPVLQAVHYMRKKGCLQSGRLSERAASKLALNVLGMSTLRLIAKSLHRVGFAETRR